VVRPNWAPHLTAAPGAAQGRPSGHPLPGEVLLASGTPAMIWPLLPTDARALREGFRRLSPEARRSRFLTAVGELDDAMIRRLVDGVDGVHHIALVLTVFPPDGHEEPVGVARLVQDPADPATADIAVTVADEWQGRGVGRALVSALMQRRPEAVSRLHTAVEAGNHASLALLAGAGHVSSASARLGVLDVTVELTAA
jgi:RimJ/RimL family protein N-acetyltransferase